MIFSATKFPESQVVEPKKLEDNRGFFARIYCQNEFEEHGLPGVFVQMNLSVNPLKGTLRGMHFQVSPHEEDKLVRCTKGALFDVIVDMRPHSSTYRQWFGIELTESNYKMLLFPKGFAHGFITLTDDTEAVYLVSQFYTPGSENGIRYNDPAIGIEWPVEPVLISDKDANWAFLEG